MHFNSLMLLIVDNEDFWGKQKLKASHYLKWDSFINVFKADLSIKGRQFPCISNIKAALKNIYSLREE